MRERLDYLSIKANNYALLQLKKITVDKIFSFQFYRQKIILGMKSTRVHSAAEWFNKKPKVGEKSKVSFREENDSSDRRVL